MTLHEEADDFETRAAAAIEDLNALIDSCHLHVSCPRCNAGIGSRCVRARYQMAGSPIKPPLKHPHRERVRAAGIALR